MKIRAERTALLVVDMQNGFCDEAGSVTAIGLPPLDCDPRSVAASLLLGRRERPRCRSFSLVMSIDRTISTGV